MGGSSSTYEVHQLNKIIYDVMIKNNLGCNQTVINDQSLCANGLVIGLYQQQQVKAQTNCTQDQSYNFKIQQDMKAALKSYTSADSKWFSPSVAVTDVDPYIENIVDVNFTNENIMQINNSIVNTQSIDLGCTSGTSTTAIGIYQDQNVDASLKAIQDVMSKTTFYQDMLGNYDVSNESSATFLGGFVMFVLIVAAVIVAYLIAQLAADPDVRADAMKVAVIA